MDLKYVAALAAVVVFVLFFVLFYHPVLGLRSNEEVFLNSLQNSEDLLIVMDIRGIDDQLIRKNVLQCGVDLAGSEGLVLKNKTYLSLSDEGCVTEDGSTTVDRCFEIIKNAELILYVKEGSGPQYFSKGAEIGINTMYDFGMCRVNPEKISS